MSNQLEKVKNNIEKKFIDGIESIDELVKKSNNLKVTDNVMVGIGKQMVSDIRERKNKITDIAEETSAPYKAIVKYITDKEEEYLAIEESCENRVSEKITAYVSEERKKANKDTERDNKIIEGIAKIQKALNAKVNSCKTDEDADAAIAWINDKFPPLTEKQFGRFLSEAEAIKTNTIKQLTCMSNNKDITDMQEVDVMEEVQKKQIAIEKAKAKEAVKGVITTRWAYEVDDISKVDIDLLMINPGAVKIFMSKLKKQGAIKKGDDIIIGGIRYFQKESTAIR